MSSRPPARWWYPDRCENGRKRMQYRPGLLHVFLASTGLDLTPFCNAHH